ncbi:hypothetical protein BJX62DRAFT_224755 [Aspergillus germanicus]
MPEIDMGYLIRLGVSSKSGRSIAEVPFTKDAVLRKLESFTPQNLATWSESDMGRNHVDYDWHNSLEMILEGLAIYPEFYKIILSLGLAPCLHWQVHEKGHYGLGRRVVSPTEHETSGESGSYHIWFTLPTPSFREEKERERDPEEQEFFDDLHVQFLNLPVTQLSFSHSMQCFYMKIDLESRRTRIFTNCDDLAMETVHEICENGVQREDYDPFIFICGIVSDLLESWVIQRTLTYKHFQEIEARKLLLELHQLRSYQLRQTLNLGHLLNVINESLQEHDDARRTLDISLTRYVQVHKNPCTLASWAKGMKQDLDMTQKTTDSCLSTLSLLLNMRNNQSVEQNTKFLATMAEHSSNENHQVKHIAEATQKDSEAMKTIAMMTMFYLPASFVAGRRGVLSLSSYWWIYAVVAIPLTVCTFFFFWFMHGRQQREGKATEAKRVE